MSDQPDFTNFSNGVRMNAGLTKYYALACDNVIIYDGRVGAALCLLVRYFLEGKGDSAPQDVPGELAFRWGAQNARRGRARPRDPSSTRYKFSPLAYASDREWARCNVLADWVLTEARARASASWCRAEDGLRRIEAALFMIGYDVSNLSETQDCANGASERSPWGCYSE
jgi:hypothetical protein